MVQPTEAQKPARMPAPKAMIDEMVKRTTPLWDEYTKPMGKEAVDALAAYRKATIC